MHVCQTLALATAAVAALAGAASAARYDGRLQIVVQDEATGEPLAARLTLQDARGRAVRLRPEGAAISGDNLYLDGDVTLDLRRGDYTFLLEAGPEFRTRPGRFAIERHAEDSETITLKRIVDMRQEGWYAGDLDVDAPLETLPLMMRARAVDFVPAVAARTVGDRWRVTSPRPATRDDVEPDSRLCGLWSVRDARGGGFLAIFDEESRDVAQFCRDQAGKTSLTAIAAAHDAGATIVALSPRAWALPVWIAAGQIDAVQVIGNADSKTDGALRPYDSTRYPGAAGRGRADEAIYHRLLNCGLRLPPVASSGLAPGASRMPALGENRTYVHVSEAFSRQSWLAGLRAGSAFATNGPLLRTRVEGHAPGHVFALEAGQRRQFEISLDLAFYDATNVDYLEIVKNGRVVHEVRLADLAAQGGRVPKVDFDSSGWFLIRAVTENPDLYQVATTGPYYVQAGAEPYINREAVEYFLDGLDAAAQRGVVDAGSAQFEAAQKYWSDLKGRSTGDSDE